MQYENQDGEGLFGPYPRRIQAESGRKAFHYGDGSHKRFETEREHDERRLEAQKAQYYEDMACKHRRNEKFRKFAAVLGISGETE